MIGATEFAAEQLKQQAALLKQQQKEAKLLEAKQQQQQQSQQSNSQQHEVIDLEKDESPASVRQDDDEPEPVETSGSGVEGDLHNQNSQEIQWAGCCHVFCFMNFLYLLFYWEISINSSSFFCTNKSQFIDKSSIFIVKWNENVRIDKRFYQKHVNLKIFTLCFCIYNHKVYHNIV